MTTGTAEFIDALATATNRSPEQVKLALEEIVYGMMDTELSALEYSMNNTIHQAIAEYDLNR